MKDWLPWVCVVLTIFIVGLLVGDEDGYRPGEIDEYPPSVDWDEEEEDDGSD